MSNKTIVISGSSGFVGKNLINLLLESNKYTIVPLDIETGTDLTQKKQLKNIPPFEIFIHLANLVYVPASYKNPELFYRINYLTTLNALELCRNNNAKIIYISSYLYGNPRYLPIDENHPINPTNPYAQSKYICEKLCEGYYRDFGVNTTILRPFNIYGAGQKGYLLIPEIIQQLKEGKKQILLRDPNPRRDYINVMDVARAIIKAIDIKGNNSIYNVCSGISYSVKEITEIINAKLKNPVQFIFGKSDRHVEIDETKGSYLKIKEELDWQPLIEFEKGIEMILNNENL
jgi:nucleoside-diphosphate-sugar epimerase